MSIASEIQRIQNGKSILKAKLNDRNDEQHQITNETIDEYGPFVDSIPTGIQDVKEKDVNFIDYDGRLLYSYTSSEFANLTAMPDNPTHDGLTSQGWNWSLSNAKTYVANNGKLIIGQMYVPIDGATKVYINVNARKSLYLGFAINGSATVNWGDETTSTVTGSSTSTIIYTPHTYLDEGDYVISISSTDSINIIASGNISSLITNGTNSFNSNGAYANMIKKVELGNNVEAIGAGGFRNCYSLETITLSNNITNIGSNSFRGCYVLQGFVIPNTTTTLGGNVLQQCSSIAYVSIPNNSVSIRSSFFANCYSLKTVTIPTNVTGIENNAISYCYALEKQILPSNITSISDTMFGSSYSLQSIIMLGDITSIEANAFLNCYGVKYYDFTNCTDIPVLANINAFSGIASDCKIVVPDSLYNDWIAETNWVTYSSYIIKESDYSA